MELIVTPTSTATVAVSMSDDGVNWQAVRALMDMMRQVMPVEILIAPDMIPEFNLRLANHGVISETHSLNIFKFSGVPVVAHPYLTGKHGAMRYSNGEVVPFFWGERS